MAAGKRRLAAVVAIAAAAVAARLIRYEIAEESMRPALRPGDWVVALRDPRKIARGDVVVLDLPGRPGFQVVKRVAATEGDRLETPDGPRTVPPGEVWVLGDDPAAGSVDSRHFGPVRRGQITARLLWRYRPLPLTRVGSPAE